MEKDGCVSTVSVAHVKDGEDVQLIDQGQSKTFYKSLPNMIPTDSIYFSLYYTTATLYLC